MRNASIRKNYKFDISSTVKVCIKCNIEKPTSEFYSIKKGKRFSSYCKYCECRKPKKRIPKEVYTKFYKEHKKESALRSYKKIDKKKGFVNDLTFSYLLEQLDKHCVYCGYPSTGLDRIDNSLGHTQNNCIPCCKECNIARMNNFSHQEMFILGLSIKQIKDNRK